MTRIMTIMIKKDDNKFAVLKCQKVQDSKLNKNYEQFDFKRKRMFIELIMNINNEKN